MQEAMDEFNCPWQWVKDFVDGAIQCIDLRNYGDAEKNLKRLKLTVDIMAKHESAHD